MLLLRRQDIQKVFSMRDAIEANKRAFAIYSRGDSVVPLRTNVGIPKYNGQTLFMPGYVEGINSLGVKIVSVFPDNAKTGKNTVPATLLLIDGTSGEVCCILDGTYVTQLRTGAAAGAATEVLARPDAAIGAVIGAGGQSAAQLEAMLCARPLKAVRVFSVRYERAAKFADKMQQELASYGAEIYAVKSPELAVADADIITTVTTSRQPVFDGRQVKAGVHINAIGSYMPDMQELDEHLVSAADKIFCDSKEAVMAEAGDVLIPIAKGLINKEKITGEIGQIFGGSINGRDTANQITIFKTVGIAVQDIVTAHEIYRKAQMKNIGLSWG